MNAANCQSEAPSTTNLNIDIIDARLIYEQPRLSHFGSLTELTKGGTFTGPDELFPGNDGSFG
jgi:hypothetical protein